MQKRGGAIERFENAECDVSFRVVGKRDCRYQKSFATELNFFGDEWAAGIVAAQNVEIALLVGIECRRDEYTGVEICDVARYDIAELARGVILDFVTDDEDAECRADARSAEIDGLHPGFVKVPSAKPPTSIFAVVE